jgi:hypothetical protein
MIMAARIVCYVLQLQRIQMTGQTYKRIVDGNSLHHTQTVTVNNIDWKCKYCSYINNEEVSWAVFGDYDNDREGARVCVMCYKYCAR